MKGKEKAPLGGGKYLLIGAGLLVGVLLLVAGNFGGNTQETGEADAPVYSAEEYCRDVEDRLEKICTSVKGAGEVRIMVSLVGGYESVYERNGDGECVTVGSGKGESAVLSALRLPEIGGVGIVATGAGNERVKNELASLVSATLGIGVHKIYVTS